MARPVVLFPMVMSDLEGHAPNRVERTAVRSTRLSRLSLLSLQAILRQQKQSTEAQLPNRFWFYRCIVSVG